jgi:hypothetical protein
MLLKDIIARSIINPNPDDDLSILNVHFLSALSVTPGSSIYTWPQPETSSLSVENYGYAFTALHNEALCVFY